MNFSKSCIFIKGTIFNTVSHYLNGCFSCFRGYHKGDHRDATSRCQLLIIGGGTAGISLASKIARICKRGEVAVVEPSNRHYYQPAFALVALGIKSLESCSRATSYVVPCFVKWIRDTVEKVHANDNYVVTSLGFTIHYEFLVVAAGLTMDFRSMPCLEEALMEPESGVCSIYSPKYVNGTLKALERITYGNLVFTMPDGPVNSPVTPQNIMYLVDDYLRKKKKRRSTNIIYYSATPKLYEIESYSTALWKICNERKIQVNLRRKLRSISPFEKMAFFENVDNPSKPPTRVKYTFLHVTPEMRPPEFLKSCRFLADDEGFCDVDPKTLQHNFYSNIFAIGDCTNLPTTKTAAAAAVQSLILEENLIKRIEGQPFSAKYDGYTVCPILTSCKTCMLDEHIYKNIPDNTLRSNQAKESKLMFFLCSVIFPLLYWNLLTRGNWNRARYIRKFLQRIVKQFRF